MTTFDLMFRKTILIALFGIIFLLYSCEEESAPAVAYLEVSELLVASKSSEGTSSAKLNTIWSNRMANKLAPFLLRVVFQYTLEKINSFDLYLVLH